MKKLTPKQIIDMWSKLKGERGTWETHWQEVADLMFPRKNTITVTRSPGEKRAQQLLDNTGVQANELLAGALHGMLTSPNSLWFELTTGDEQLDKDDEVKNWLYDSTLRVHNVLNNSNFQMEVHEMYLDLTAFGTGVMLVEEDDRAHVRFNTKFIADYLIDENHMGFVDRILFTWSWTAEKIINEYGMDKVPKKVLDAFKKNDMAKFKLIQIIYPRTMVGDAAGQFPFISQTILEDEKVELREGKFREFPVIVPRWSKASGEVYGRSPGMNALPEMKTLNKMAEVTLNGAQKVVDPPLQLPDDGFIMPIITKPGGLNYYRSGSQDIIRPVFNDTRIDFGFQALSEKRQRVREAFYVDQLMTQQGPQMTATEVLQRTEEKMRLLGPMLGRQQSELLRPLIDRVFGIMFRKNLLLPPPQALQGQVVDVKYSSMVAKAQRVNEGQAILRAFEASAPFIQLDQAVGDNFDGDRAVKVIASIYGTPPTIFKTKKEVEAARQARQQAQQAALQQQQEAHEAEQMSKVAPLMQEGE
jgi:hypothetical protein